MTVRTKDKQTPAGRRMEKQFKAIKKGPHVKAGILQDEFAEPKETDEGQPITTVGEVGVVNEFGTSDGRIPERSYIRSTWEEKQREWMELAKKLKHQVILGRITHKKMLNLMGLQMVADIKQKITDLKEPALADSTIDRKGSSNPLIDIGQMREAISHEVNA